MKLWFAAALALTAIACGTRGDEGGPPPAPRAAATPAPAVADAKPGPAAAARPRIAVLGDSLTAGLGIAKAASYPSLLQQRLDAAHLDFEVVNAGVSGDTSAGGLARLDWALDGGVRILLVALGGNEGPRGLPAGGLRHHLGPSSERALARGIA